MWYFHLPFNLPGLALVFFVLLPRRPRGRPDDSLSCPMLPLPGWGDSTYGGGRRRAALGDHVFILRLLFMSLIFQ